MSDECYLALIADIVASRDQEDRGGFQLHDLKAIEKVNEKLRSSALAAPLTLTAGDEIQGLLREPEAAVLVIQELTDRRFGSAKFPYLVFGLGYGTLSTGPVPASPDQAQSPLPLDGPCFHLAREALQEASRTRTWARWAGLGTPRTATLNALFDLMGAIRSDWTAKQGINTYQVRGHKHQKGWAAELGVSKSVISESLKAAHYEAILGAETVARKLLEAP